MKNILSLCVLALACCNAYAQTAQSTSNSGATAGAQAGATAIGGGAATSTSSGGAGGNGGNGNGGAASSNVTVNLGSSNPSGAGANPTNASAVDPSGGTTTHVKESLQTVGNPGAVSYGVSFSQFNCQSTAALGAGFMGGVFQLGGGVESGPCNDRANASALFQIAGALQKDNAALSSQLYHAAILLIGNSTKETQAALAQAGVSDWAPAQQPAATVDPSLAALPAAPKFEQVAEPIRGDVSVSELQQAHH
ncbi:hypothetical protein [Paraburkholderia mimosarum]|uniref:hypothetical protein n=1 Tax=Paraburkholderia mimosarum TaxID=312026 RepID=UPI000415065A|nr:hypothetical protein [Paraburkholderia mimosarum]